MIYPLPIANTYHTLPTPPQPLQQQYQPPVVTAKPKFKLRYIMCTELFTKYTQESFIVLDPAKTTMENFVEIIHATHKVHESLQIELFSEDGYPLNVNPFTIKCKEIT